MFPECGATGPPFAVEPPYFGIFWAYMFDHVICLDGVVRHNLH